MCEEEALSAVREGQAAWPKHMRPEDAGQLQHLRKPFVSLSLGVRFNIACVLATILLAAAVSIYVLPISYFSSVGINAAPTAMADVLEVRDFDDGLPANLRPGFQSMYEDGVSLDAARAYDLATSGVRFASQVGEQFQYQQGMPSGCEVVSLSIVLESMGCEISARDLVNQYLVRDSSAATAYQGSPYGVGTGFPASIAATANAYLQHEGKDAAAHDLTGSPFSSVRALVESGYPVLVWSTVHMQEPMKSGVAEGGQEKYDNMHCVVVYGFKDGEVLVSDPIDGLIARDEIEFARLYEACGNMALAIY